MLFSVLLVGENNQLYPKQLPLPSMKIIVLLVAFLAIRCGAILVGICYTQTHAWFRVHQYFLLSHSIPCAAGAAGCVQVFARNGGLFSTNVLCTFPCEPLNPARRLMTTCDSHAQLCASPVCAGLMVSPLSHHGCGSTVQDMNHQHVHCQAVFDLQTSWCRGSSACE